MKESISNSPPLLNRPLQDLEYFLAHRDQLMADYHGQYVAIRRGEIVGAARTRRELQSVLQDRFGEKVYAFVRQVSDAAFDTLPDETLAI